MTVLEKDEKRSSVMRFLNKAILVGTLLSYVPTGYQLVKICTHYLK